MNAYQSRRWEGSACIHHVFHLITCVVMENVTNKHSKRDRLQTKENYDREKTSRLFAAAMLPFTLLRYVHNFGKFIVHIL
jgi:hypothetical protein